MPNSLDWSHVNECIDQLVRDEGIANRSKAFGVFSIKTVLGFQTDEAFDCLTDGTGDRGIDAIAIIRDIQPVVHLFQFKCCESFASAKNNFPSREIDKIKSFVSDLLSRKDGFLDACNTLLATKVHEIYELLEKDVPKFVVHLCSNGTGLIEHERKRLSADLKALRVFDCREHDLESLAARLIDASRPPIDVELKLTGKTFVEKTDGDVRGLVATISAEALVKLIVHPANKRQINLNVFHENIRVFLGVANPVNEQIYQSAIDRKNYRFWYLNNGITMTCDSYAYTPGLSNPPIFLKNLQIVNGIQTSSTLFEVYLGDKEKLKDVEVLVRIYETKSKDLSGDIAKATNSQTRIYDRDLMSNDPTQRKLEAIYLAKGYYYERKKNQHLGRQLEKRIDAHRLGQCYLAFFLETPDRAKTQSEQIFSRYYGEIFGPDFQPDDALAAFLLHSEIEARRSRVVEEMRGVTGRSHPHSFLTHGSFHVLYAVRVLLDSQRKQLREVENKELLLQEALKVVATVVQAQKDKSLYEIFRHPRSTRLIGQYGKQVQGDLFS